MSTSAVDDLLALTEGSRQENAEVTSEQAQSIMEAYLGHDTKISSFEALPTEGFSAFTPCRNYAIRLADGERYVLRVQPSSSSTRTSAYTPNTLATEAHLMSLLAKQTIIPHPTLHKLDQSLLLVPYQYLLLSHPGGVPLSHTRSTLTDRQNMVVDLHLGIYYQQLHFAVQNDWFGLPSQEKDKLYSWQEAFTYLLESLLHEAQELELGLDIPFEEVRRYLSRAIGSFLFDDCEIPSLVSFTGDDDSIFIHVGESEEDVKMTSLIPVSHAIWGDPLLEFVFMEDPSPAFLESYGGNPVVFARQRTKRMWYTLFLALMVTNEAHRQSETPSRTGEGKDKVIWARDAIVTCIAKLKDAPCY
ncbi:hypothetical protein BC835DRAFT_1279773 [Cytidiella melzeri]|nr:hypothetical protein BC835DRAFT_1279773 [Cytidiella melzeri]